METTQIELFGLTVTEPFTWLTNWTVAAFSYYFGHMLFHSKTGDKQAKYWSIFFVFMGIASTTGGTAHGFVNYVGSNFHYAAWIFTGIAVFAAQMASLEVVTDARVYAPLKWFVIIELLVMTAAVVFFQSFEAVRINSALALVGIALPIQIYGYKFLGMRRNGIIALGIISNVAPALIHAGRFSYNKWFNFNDLSHIVMIGCFYIIYLGAKKIAIKNPVGQKGAVV
ncbi:MAG: hypothetical protein DRI71_07095 [Bacteroidetes bacterium]|nr:MAG: hypothetical protein DRI71_07095 [Bacteroidota bacterium]